MKKTKQTSHFKNINGWHVKTTLKNIKYPVSHISEESLRPVSPREVKALASICLITVVWAGTLLHITTLVNLKARRLIYCAEYASHQVSTENHVLLLDNFIAIYSLSQCILNYNNNKYHHTGPVNTLYCPVTAKVSRHIKPLTLMVSRFVQAIYIHTRVTYNDRLTKTFQACDT